MRRTNLLLRLLDCLKDARSEKRENRGTQTGHAFARNQDRSSQDIRIDSIQHIILLRNTAGIDYSLDVNSMTGHAVQNHSSMKSGSFNSGEQLVLRGTLQIPTQRYAAQVRIHQYRAVAVVPGQPQQPGLSCAILLKSLT